MGDPLDPSSVPDPLLTAVERFDRAIEAVEARLAASPGEGGGDAALRAALEASRRSEAELAEAAEEAAQALNDAITELKAGLPSAGGR